MKRRVDTIDEFVKKSNSQDIDEKSTSIAQQRLFGMAWAVRSGAMKRDDVPESVLKIVDSNMSDEEMKKFAKTSHTGLPMHKTNEEHVNEVVGLPVVKRNTNWESIRIYPDPDNDIIEILCKNDIIEIKKSEIQGLIEALKKYI